MDLYAPPGAYVSSMARPASQIRDSLQNSVRAANPNTDLAKGPVFDILVAPVAPELAETEQVVEDLRTLTSLQFAQVATTDEANAIGTAFGISELEGASASTRETFWTSTRPTDDITIERGTVVGTNDASLVFVVTERVTMLASNASAYLNANRRRYEITARVQAVASGTNYNLPAFRINRLITPIDGIDGVENREEATGGSEQQSISEYLSRIQLKFLGLNGETGGALTSQVFEQDPANIKNVVLVYPKDRKIFRRDIGRPAVDCYIVGGAFDSVTEQYVAVGGEQSVTLLQGPVADVSSVLVDGAPASGFSLLNDSDPNRSGSARAQDVVLLTTPLVAGQVVLTTYTTHKTIRDVQDMFDSSEHSFGTDLLARLPIDVPVTVQLDCTVLPSFDVSRVSDQVNTVVAEYCEPEFITTSLTPETLVNRITSNVSGVASVTVNRFTSTNGGALPVETITFQKNELPKLDQATLVIQARQ